MSITNVRSKINERKEEQSAASSLITTFCAGLNFSSSDLLSYQEKVLLSKRRGLIILLVIFCRDWARPYAVQLLHQGSESKFKITTNVNMSCDNGRGAIQNVFD